MSSCYTPRCTPDIPVPTPTPLPPCTEGEPCAEATDAACVVYTNEPLPAVNVATGDRLHDIIRKWAQAVLSQTQAITTQDTEDIDFSGTGLASIPLTALVKLNPDAHNLIRKSPQGLITVVDLCLLKDLATLVNSNAEAHDIFCELVEGCASGHCGTAVNLQVTFNGQLLQATWIPFPTNVSSQVVQYKKLQEANWSSQTNIHFSIAAAEIPTVFINSVYQVRIQTNCLLGGPSFNIPLTISTAVCPQPHFISSFDSISFSFNYEVQDYSNLQFSLIRSDNSLVSTKVFELTRGTTQLVTGAFNNLEPGENYQLQITMRTPLGEFYTKNCPPIPLTTQQPPMCSFPSNLQAVAQ